MYHRYLNSGQFKGCTCNCSMLPVNLIIVCSGLIYFHIDIDTFGDCNAQSVIKISVLSMVYLMSNVWVSFRVYVYTPRCTDI